MGHAIKFFVKDVEAKILLEDKYSFNIKLSIGIFSEGSFYLKMKFHNLGEDEINILVGLGDKPQRLKIHSDYLLKPEYKISYIKVDTVRYVNDGSAQWECSSNDPKLYSFLQKIN